MREVFIFLYLYEGFNSNGTMTVMCNTSQLCPQHGFFHCQGNQLPSKAFKKIHVFQGISRYSANRKIKRYSYIDSKRSTLLAGGTIMLVALQPPWRQMELLSW